MSGVKGDFDALKKLQLRIGQIADGTFNDKLKRNLGQQSVKLVADEFRGGFDPWGQKWKALRHKRRRKKSKRTDKPLNDTGRLRASFSYDTTSNGYEIGTNVVYAAIHQYGGVVARDPRTFKLHFNKKGRFMSSRVAARRKKPPKTITVKTGFYTIEIPQRAFIPIGGPGTWEVPLLKVAKSVMDKFLRDSNPT